MTNIESTLKIIDTHTGHYEYVKTGDNALPTNHFMPYEQCPSCGDIGQDSRYVGFGEIEFSCPFCHVSYKVVFTDKGVLNKRK